MSKVTQSELIMSYVRIRGSITPAKLSDADKSFFGEGMFLGSETGKRCRELRSEGKLISVQVGRFEEFYLPDKPRQSCFMFGNVLMGAQ